MAKTAGTKKTEGTESKTKKTTAPKAEEAKKVHAKKHDDKAASAPKKASTKKVKTASAEGKMGRCGGKSCKIKNCKRTYKAKGYCRAHYKMWRRGAYGKTRFTACKDHGCFKPMATNRHGFCEDHFQNYYVKGMEQVKVEAPAKKEEAPAAAAG
jgi:hypothetical protein